MHVFYYSHTFIKISDLKNSKIVGTTTFIFNNDSDEKNEQLILNSQRDFNLTWGHCDEDYIEYFGSKTKDKQQMNILRFIFSNKHIFLNANKEIEEKCFQKKFQWLKKYKK